MVGSRNVLSIAGAFAAAFVTLVLFMDLEVNVFDEGLILVDSMRAQAGEIVHRDYYANYGPGSSYMVAAIFSVFGRGFISAAVYGIAVMAGISAAIFGLLINRCSIILAATGSAVFVFWSIHNTAYLYPSYPCAFLALIATGLLIQPEALNRNRLLFYAGACAGLTALFRYDTGFFLAFAQGLAITIAVITNYRKNAFGYLGRAYLYYGLGVAIIFLPAAAAFLSASSASYFYDDIIDYTVKHYAKARHLPFPMPWSAFYHATPLAIYSPLITVAIASPVIVKDTYENEDNALPLTLALACLVIVLYYKGLVRPTPLHMMLSIVPAIPLAILTAERYLIKNAASKLVAIGLIGVTAAPATNSAVWSVIGRPARAMPLGRLVTHEPTDAETLAAERCAASPWMRGAIMKPYYARVVRFLSDHSRPGEKIFVGLTKQGRIFVNPIALYYAADRMPMTHWAQFDPGLQSRADIQKMMVDELSAKRPRWIVRDGSFDEVYEPNESSIDSGVRLVDRYINSNYRMIARAEKVQMWLRNDVAAPSLYTGSKECWLTPVASVS